MYVFICFFLFFQKVIFKCQNNSFGKFEKHKFIMKFKTRDELDKEKKEAEVININNNTGNVNNNNMNIDL